MLVTYSGVVVLASLAMQHSGELGLTFAPCGDEVCVAWVLPAGHAWHDGARPGMRVVSLNGKDPREDGGGPVLVAEIRSPKGDALTAHVTDAAIARPWARRSLWLTGAVFALLGAVVLVRHPDAAVARLFALFAWLTGVALGVSPAAGGPHPAWSLVVQFLSLITLAACLPAFASAFVGGSSRSRAPLLLFWTAGGILLLAYAASLLLNPSLYRIVRAGFASYLAAGILAALVILARKAFVRRPERAARDARLALSGIACGTLPFVALTLIPQATVQRDLMPAYVAAVFWSVIPVTFAYAILHHQALGIRRLVHRGMVHGATTVLLILVMLAIVVVTDSFLLRYISVPHPAWISAVFFALAAGFFYALRHGIRITTDRFVYGRDVDSGALLARMRGDLLGSESADDVIVAMVRRLQQSMRLEAISLFLGSPPETMRVVSSAGPRAQEAIAFVRPRLAGFEAGWNSLSEVRWDSEVLLVAPMASGGETLGFLVLGPKERGEVFLGDERRLVETVSPILALTIREMTLLAELRELSGRLTNAQEAERARLARELHDGPLQKAILLSALPDATLRDRYGVARDLASELRELCARLRPAILDDLGLVPALEWLLDQTARGFSVTPRLTLRGLTEDDRLTPDAELAFFRVTQEAVSNALRHGRATSIDVTLTKASDAVQLTVTDDGTGYVSTASLARGLGISGMRERLRQVGGSVVVASNGIKGTRVTARLPNRPEEGP